MDDKRYFPASENVGNFAFQQQYKEQPYDYSQGHFNDSPFESSSSPNANQQRSVGHSPQRCYQNSPSLQFRSETSFGKYGNAQIANNNNNGLQSYANATAASPIKFDPFGYNLQPSRSSSQHNYQSVSPLQQRLDQTHQQQQRHNFDDAHYLHKQQSANVCPSMGISPTTSPSTAQAFLSHSRAVQQQQASFPPQRPTTTVGHFQQHFRPQSSRGATLPPHLPSQSFFPTGPPSGTMGSTPVMNNFGTDNGQPPSSYMFDGQMPTDGGAGLMVMNGTGGPGTGTIDFNDDFSGGINGTMPAQYILSDELMAKIQNSTKRKTLLELQIGLEQIAYDVSNIFETWAMVIKDRLVGSDRLPPSDLEIGAAILIEMAVVLDESQYNYSRLGQYLCRTIDNFATSIFFPQISVFVNETNTFLSAQHLRNLVLFLAELYDKLEVNGVKPSELAAHLFDQLRNLIKLDPPVTDQTVDATVKTLKLVGRFLENDRGPQAMAEFLQKFDQSVQDNSDQLSESAREKVRCLFTLRDNKWGVVADIGAAPNIGDGPMVTASSSVGIFGPDGVPLTEDECAFMEENLDNFVDNSPGGSQGLNAFDEDNVEDDYEKFLQATAVRAAEKALEKVSIDEDDDASSIVSSQKFSTSK